MSRDSYGNGNKFMASSELNEDALGSVTFRELPTFPERELPIISPLNVDSSLLSNYKKRLDKTFQESPYYLVLPKPKGYIERFGDRFMSSSKLREQSLAGYCPFDTRYFPEELQFAYDQKQRGSEAQKARQFIGTAKGRKSGKEAAGSADLNSVRQILEEAEKSDKVDSNLNRNIANEEEENFDQVLNQEDDDFDEDLEGEYIQDYYDEDFDPFADNDEQDDI